MMGKNGEIFQGRSGPNIYMIICEKNVTYTYNMFFFLATKRGVNMNIFTKDYPKKRMIV